MRRKNDTLQEVLLNVARNIADTEGIERINIRVIAKEAGVATGTVYNYFSNKDEILLELTEGYWRQALIEMKEAITEDSFCGQLEEIFVFLKERITHSAGKLMNSLSSLEVEGQERMAAMQLKLQYVLLLQMEKDSTIRKDIWDKNFTKEQFIRFIMINMIALLKEKEPDIDFFITLVKRIIY